MVIQVCDSDNAEKFVVQMWGRFVLLLFFIKVQIKYLLGLNGCSFFFCFIENENEEGWEKESIKNSTRVDRPSVCKHYKH